MYEGKNEPLLSREQFIWRLVWHALVGVLAIVGSTVIGMLGFIYFEGMLWHDAFLHSLFLLSGLGTISVPVSVAGKVFLGVYGMYAGLVFVAVLGVMFAPIAHRILHSFHVDSDNS